MDWKNIINDDWTLFLDRDGVINVRIIDGYVTKIEEFEFLPDVIESFKIFKNKFKRIKNKIWGLFFLNIGFNYGYTIILNK